MNRHENKTFENQHLVLDDAVFINCVFKNCSLEYSGSDVYVQNCQGEGCQLVWRGAAQRTVFLLQGLGLMAPPPPPSAATAPSRVQSLPIVDGKKPSSLRPPLVVGLFSFCSGEFISPTGSVKPPLR